MAHKIEKRVNDFIGFAFKIKHMIQIRGSLDFHFLRIPIRFGGLNFPLPFACTDCIHSLCPKINKKKNKNFDIN